MPRNLHRKPTRKEHHRYRMLVGPNPTAQHFAVRGSGPVALCSYELSRVTEMRRPVPSEESLPACGTCRELAVR
jgi:hypothetical protein